MATSTQDPVSTRTVRDDLMEALRVEEASIRETHLRDLMADADRCRAMVAEHDGIVLDYSRQRATTKTMELLFKLAESSKLSIKIQEMMMGVKINTTENRAVLHVALRAAPTDTIAVDGKDVVPEVIQVRSKISAFSARVRSEEWVGATGKALTDVVAIGIGGSYLGPEFVYEALRTDPKCAKAAEGRKLRFLANVDPVDVARATEGLDPETTLVVVVSKTFTTAETMLNARTMRKWLVDALGQDAVAKHMIAVSTNLKAVEAFGIDPDNAFGFWDWVGGRYSVCSAVGLVPLALHFGFDAMEMFLSGARNVDKHFAEAKFDRNIPVIMGLLGVWNSTFLGYETRALLPYQQALLKLAPHIQQVDMESNGKRVRLNGSELPFPAGPINFGEPGTNGQHSFYQLMHQGRVVPADFIGCVKSQQPIALDGEPVTNHEELMSNFFAQPDALAYGKTAEEVRAEGVAEELVPHKVFSGNRPSSSMLLPELDAYRLGQLLAIFEHRTAVEGFVWEINSFDQWGVELGKVLAKQVRSQISAHRAEGKEISGFNPSTTFLLSRFLEG
eukprot:CAMPEP_0198315900 /NCGR_PEP_ID=MMETSP1450-20131203/5993_1 /TAXON_ID=753684 ORGANISM="Madagascaria erythrocladiodes, Strain CCMP3234" /NCGR_SAMPLE_ID=MMETSP1450 /ASSEMBLY_ACC=CAM_ASM_001115 /LENGTH=559 /DNA_ID=CAMNT_0044019027 /DNA_START=55 /DNA_END=1734 /DNA_ORIENTATION=+